MLGESEVLSWVKIVAALATGAFGMLGLLVEYKDHSTKRITRWGYVSIAGIILSTTLGIVAQVLESNESAKSAAASASASAATAILAEQAATASAASARDTQRILTPISRSQIAIGLELDCLSSSEAAQVCEKWRKNPGPKFSTRISLQILFSDRKRREDSARFEGAIDFNSEALVRLDLFETKHILVASIQMDGGQLEDGSTAQSSLDIIGTGGSVIIDENPLFRQMRFHGCTLVFASGKSVKIFDVKGPLDMGPNDRRIIYDFTHATEG